MDSKNSKKKKKRKKYKHVGETILVLSALFLGVLTVILVYRNKINRLRGAGGEVSEERVIKGAFPLPSEVVESDKATYFASMEIPDIIWSRMDGNSVHEECPVDRSELRYLTVLYWGTDNEAHRGELVVNYQIADDVTDIFFKLYKASYPIESIKLVDEYGGSDEVSMAKNNTSCFNGRKATGSDSYSMHAYGLAIDLNPLYNPYIGSDGSVLPVTADAYADRTKNFLLKIDENDYAYKLFTEHGFTWGGSWNTVKDYQHFEKEVN